MPLKTPRPRIDEWAAVDGGACPFQAPEMRPIKLTGIVSRPPQTTTAADYHSRRLPQPQTNTAADYHSRRLPLLVSTHAVPCAPCTADTLRLPLHVCTYPPVACAQVSNHPVLKDGPISTSLIQMIDEARGVAWTIR